MAPIVCGDIKCGAWITDDQDPNLDIEIKVHAELVHHGEVVNVKVDLVA